MKRKSRTFVSLLCAAVLSLSAAAMPVMPGSIGSLTATAVSAAPKAPSSDYTGIVKSGSNSYYFENGVMLRSGWKTIKKGKYYYADKDGKLTTYEFKQFTYEEMLKEEKYYRDNKIETKDRGKHKVGELYLYINGKPIYKSDCKDGFFSEEYLSNFCKFDEDYIYIYSDCYCGYIISGSTLFAGEEHGVYDVATGEELYRMLMREDNYGDYEIVEYRYKEHDYNCKEELEVYNRLRGVDLENNKKVTIVSGEKTSVKKAGKIIISTEYSYTDENGKYLIEFYNNTGKTIKKIYFGVKYVDRSGKTVVDKLTGKTKFTLKHDGPIGNKECSKEWIFDEVIYNEDAYAVELQSIKVVFSDGSSEIYKYSSEDITNLYHPEKSKEW